MPPRNEGRFNFGVPSREAQITAIGPERPGEKTAGIQANALLHGRHPRTNPSVLALLIFLPFSATEPADTEACLDFRQRVFFRDNQGVQTKPLLTRLPAVTR